MVVRQAQWRPVVYFLGRHLGPDPDDLLWICAVRGGRAASVYSLPPGQVRLVAVSTGTGGLGKGIGLRSDLP
jgi:hypothetical protein